MTLRESTMTERLDERDLLHVAHDPGCYALEVDVPSMPTVAKERWDERYDARPGNDAIERMANAETVAYVGASKDVYRRLCDHANAEVRKATLLSVFDPVAVLDIWPCPNPFEHEFNCAAKLADEQTRVWQDGELL